MIHESKPDLRAWSRYRPWSHDYGDEDEVGQLDPHKSSDRSILRDRQAPVRLQDWGP